MTAPALAPRAALPDAELQHASPPHALPAPSADGLEGVVVAHTALSDVDGERGRLVIAGHDVEPLALATTYEDALGLLLDGALPDGARREALRAALGDARAKAFACGAADAMVRSAPDGMSAIRIAVASVPMHADATHEAQTLELAGAAAVALAAHGRSRAGKAPIAPDPARAQAADLLAMLDADASPPLARALDTYLVTVCDHGLNASTFTARVVASTGASLGAAVGAALGALEGPLHGGAPGPVLDMLDAIGAPERAEPWLEAELASGRRIMGMGHRIYRVRDPRAAVLERAIERLRESGIETPRLVLARAVERAARELLRERHPARTLDTNVEFYTAVLLDAVGLPRTLFPSTFAIGRILGWSAHVAEQRRVGRLVRPRSIYVGPAA